DADRAALAVMSGRAAAPGRSSGLGVQGCRPTVKECPPGYRWGAVTEGGAVGAGSFGCSCVYRCVPDASRLDPGPRLCPATGCTYVEVVGTDYEFRENGEVERAPVADRASLDDREVGWGGAATPLGEQATCLCPGVDIQGERTEAAHMVPIVVDATDLYVGPRDRTTGVPLSPGGDDGPVIRDPFEPHGPNTLRIDDAPAPGGARRSRDTHPPVSTWEDSPFPAVQQQGSDWCGGACGEMATGRLGEAVPQSRFVEHPSFERGFTMGHVTREGGFQTGGLRAALDDLGPTPGRAWQTANLYDLSTAGGAWDAPTMASSLRGLLDRSGAGVIMRVEGGQHWIIVDQVMPDGRFAIRDPRRQVSEIVTVDELFSRGPVGSYGDVIFSEPTP
ncbi:MAG TPA: hypothetical protein PKA64_26985, partial [Myxococcota bacterium]|nr:hypothetical protein [Myxococcota bacterium]